MIDFEIYREVVGNPRYLVSKYGSIHLKSNLNVVSQVCNNGYFYVKLEIGVAPSRFSRRMNDRGKMRVIEGMKQFKNYSVHRLVAEAWVEKSSKEDNVVNHIDGCTNNNTSLNLEWTTHKGNSIHAKELGLKVEGDQDNNVCFVRDYETGEVSMFYDVNEAKHFMGMPINVLTVQLNPIRFGVLLNQRYEFRFSFDKRPWFYETRTRKVEGRYLVTVKYPDGKVTEIFTMNDWKETFPDLPPSTETFKKFYQFAVKRHPEIKFEFRDSAEEDPFKKFRVYQRVKKEQIWVYDLETDKEHFFSCGADAGFFMGCNEKRARQVIGNPSAYKGRYLVARECDFVTRDKLLEMHK